MKIDTAADAERFTVAIGGEVDADNCRQIGDVVLDDERYQRDSDLVLDLTELGFIDSSGLTELLRVRQSVVDAGYRMSMVGLSSSVRRTMDIAGLSDTFGVS